MVRGGSTDGKLPTLKVSLSKDKEHTRVTRTAPLR